MQLSSAEIDNLNEEVLYADDIDYELLIQHLHRREHRQPKFKQERVLDTKKNKVRRKRYR